RADPVPGPPATTGAAGQAHGHNPVVGATDPAVRYTLSLHDALPISSKITCRRSDVMSKGKKRSGARPGRPQPLRGTKGKRKDARSEERFSRNAETDPVCRLLLEKKTSPSSTPRRTSTWPSGSRPGRP